MRREWEPEELLACWTLVDADWELIANKSGTTRLGFAVMLQFFEIDGRFPRSSNEVPPAALEYAGNQLHLASGEFGAYSLSGWTVEYHRAQIRASSGFRAFSASDEDKLAGWLAGEVCPVEQTRGSPPRRVADPLPRRTDRAAGTESGRPDSRNRARRVEKLIEAWRARAMRAYPSDLLDAPRTVRLTLLAALCWTRQSEITDALVDLLIGLIHRMNAPCRTPGRTRTAR